MHGTFRQYNMVSWKNTLVSNRVRDSTAFLKVNQPCLSGPMSGLELNEQFFAEPMYFYVPNEKNSLSAAQKKWFVEKNSLSVVRQLIRFIGNHSEELKGL